MKPHTVTDVSAGHKIRYSDEHLYAMAQYLYTLKPPANPNPPNAQGRKVFEREGCVALQDGQQDGGEDTDLVVGRDQPDEERTDAHQEQGGDEG